MNISNHLRCLRAILANKTRRASFFAPLAAAAFIAGCSGTEPLDTLSNFQRTQIESAYSKAEALLTGNRPVEAAQSLWNDATQFPSPTLQEFQIRAVEILLDHGHILASGRYLRQINESALDENLLLKKRIAHSQFYSETGQYEQILNSLPDSLIQIGDEKMQIAALWLVAEALYESDQLVNSIKARIRLNEIINEEERRYNTQKLFQLALAADISKVQAALADEQPPEIKNWLELAALSTPLEIDIPTLERKLKAWKSRNKKWKPPESMDKVLLARWEYLDFSPQNVSVMLPLTGTYAKYGKAVRDGLLYAYNAETDSNFSLKFRNTDTDDSIAAVYREVVDNQEAELIIGPLVKEKADRLIAEQNLTVPLITLNYSLEKPPESKNEIFRFGLLPEDETLQVAQKVRDDGHEFIVVLAPDNIWGERLLTTFSEKFLSLGGFIRQVTHYDTTLVDYSTLIENLLLLNESRLRYARVSSAIGYRPDFKPRIRDDITALVLLANSQQASLIYPQLKYHYADKLPAYATSHVYKSGKIKNRDLDGLNYLDAPIILYPEKLNVPSESLEIYPRLFALGVDTFHLVNLFRRMSLSNASYDGMTGELSITPDRRLFRKLRWAKFRNGKPVLPESAY